MERISLSVTPRTILGKKVKQLRRTGQVPAHIYGYKTEPLNVAVGIDDLVKTYRHSGETGLIDLKLDGQTIPVLIKDIQTHAVSGDFLNVDFYKVNLKEKVTVVIPVVPVGEAKAVADNIGILEQPLSEVEIEALPTDLIDEIEFNVEGLAEIDDALYVKDLVVPETVTILNDPEDMLVKIGPLMTAEMEEALEAMEAEAAEAAAEAAEDEAVKEGEEAEAEAAETTTEGESEAEEKSEE